MNINEKQDLNFERKIKKKCFVMTSYTLDLDEDLTKYRFSRD